MACSLAVVPVAHLVGSPQMETAEARQNFEPGLQADQALIDAGWLRIGAGAAIAAQAMVFSLSVNLSEISGWAYAVVHGILIVSAFATLMFLGRDLVRSAGLALKEQKINIDLLFLLTLLGALAGSLISTFTRTGSVYYEVVAILIVVHTAGKMLGARSRVAALQAADSTREQFDSCDWVQADGSVIKMSAALIREGMQVRVQPGGPISVDGEILSGRGYIQETSMTGEWRPEVRGPGDRVLAGTFSVDGTFILQAREGRRKLDAILEAVREARLAPSQLQGQADRLMLWFLPLVGMVSLATFVIWSLHGPWDRALFNAMAVLLVACPCAMGLATPVAVWGGLARLAAMGLVSRTGDILDALAKAETLYIDKTGTLSAEALVAREWRFAPGFDDRARWLREAVALVESGLAHPIARAVAMGAPAADADQVRGGRPVMRNRRVLPGRGIMAEVALPGDEGAYAWLAIGEKDLVGADQILGGSCTGRVDTSPMEGKRVHVFLDGVPAAEVDLEESWRTGVQESLRALKQLGLRVLVLSGDPGASRALADLPVEVIGGLAPEEKRAIVGGEIAKGRTVVFVGDGINDASAMSLAHVSVAMRGGADLARAASSAVFVGDDLRFLPQAIVLARKVRAGLRRNLVFAAAYNIAGMVLAASGCLHPVAAALLMLGSSVFVSVGALRSSRAGAEARDVAR